jgi:peptidoglycan/LPS O-acetylase OafA/YrhL
MELLVAPKKKVAYRADIDGLRAVAVALVVLSHLGIPHMLGGFVGVDIFFVISGYLITGNIAREIASGNFSILDFYERRFRRIVPALIGVLIATTVIAYFVFLPQELVRYAHSLLAALFSYSNLYFYSSNVGYFGVTYSNVLLHTWSLGVEEQFYLFIPVCMLLAATRANGIRWMIGVAASISFLLAAYLTFRNRDLAFYMPYTRAWELLSGSLLALGMLPLPKSRLVREALTALSILLIAICALLYKATTPFPGIAALLPCAAGVILIMVGEQGRTSLNAFLSWRPIAFIGMTSYSLYLWHWPLVVMVKLGVVYGIRAGTLAGDAFVVAASLVLAALSWRVIEQPFRSGQFKRLSQRKVFGLAGACATIFSVVAVIIQFKHGFPGRFSLEARQISTYMDVPPRMQTGKCFIETGFADFNKAACLHKVTNEKNILLFGDSHAADLWWGLKENLPHVNILQATLAACPPTFGSYRRSGCSQMRRYIYQTYLPQNSVDAVILSERWTSIEDLKPLLPALDWLRERGIPVFVIGPVPEYTAPLPFLLALGIKWNDSGLASRNRIDEMQQLDGELRSRLQGRPGVRYASVWNAVCSQRSCAEYATGSGRVPLLSDVDHLTNEASVDVIRTLQQSGELPPGLTPHGRTPGETTKLLFDIYPVHR